jgi:Trypsin
VRSVKSRRAGASCAVTRVARALCVLAAVSLSLVLVPAASASEVVYAKDAAAAIRAVRHLHEVAGARAEHAHAAVVGGSSVSVEQAPWQVALIAAIPAEREGKKGFLIELCGGAILNATEVLTAAHCVIDPETEAQVSAEDLLVVAGTSDIENKEPAEQDVEAASVRVHPYFDYAAGPGTADDVAVLKLAGALSLTGSAAQAIAMTPAGSVPAEGTQARLTGFGEENPVTEELDGQLHSLDMALGFSRQCGGEADALFLCGSAPGGSACSGDSGSGLTTTGVTPSLLLGVTDTVAVVSGERCRDGADAGFVNVAAPEIRDFIEGSDDPPRAPRGGGALISGVVEVGHSLTCEPGGWSNAPTYTFAFIDGASGQVLQQGTSSTYPLSSADVGRSILCQVQAANAGGTGVGRTPGLGPIEAGPASGSPPPSAGPPVPVSPPPAGAQTPVSPPPSPAAEAVEAGGVSLLSTTLPVQGAGLVMVKLDCAASEGCRGKLTLTARMPSRGKKRRSEMATIGTADFASGASGTIAVKIALDAAGRSLLAGGHGKLEARLAILLAVPGPAQTQAGDVRLQQTRGRGGSKEGHS